ncbi:Uncharacterised protein [uncultured archaeon]|nr:Uncharacterised protein [uncultured archaeon]
MNSQFLLEKLENSCEFKKFMKENPKAYLCSGFFEIGSEENSGDKYHFDYYIPSSKKTFSFEMENEIKLVELERFDEKVLDEVSMKNHFDFDKIKEMISREMEFQKIRNKIQRMIFSLQKIEGKDLLLGTIFLSGLGLIKFNFDIAEKRIAEFEKKSLFDMMKIVKK